MLGAHGMVRPPVIPTGVNETNVNAPEPSEIPDNVTAELEKLEQEGAPLGEVEGVSAILGDLGDDDDELLGNLNTNLFNFFFPITSKFLEFLFFEFTAEMGADFNILEYADPELDNITGGEKTNILDLDLEQVEVETKEEKQKKETKEEPKSENLGGSTTTHTDNNDGRVTSTVQTPAETTTVPTQTQTIQAITPASQNSQTAIQVLPQAHPISASVQQMNHHVQQAAALGRPMAPGTKLLAPDGTIGIVTSTNTVTVSYPTTFPGHPQRIAQTHLQGEKY